MASRDLFIRHLFGGGFATDLGPSTDAAPQGSQEIAQLTIPWLNRADNVMFDLDGGPLQSPGTTKINAAALESGAAIRGCYDYWIQGSTGSPTQKRVIHVGTKIKADAGDGNFSDIATGMSATGVPSYATFNDELIITDDANTAPKKWSGSGSTSALGGSPPNFAWCVEHKGRLFAGGVPSHPSRLYYSDAFNHESGWTNYITIGTNDGSGLTGAASYKDALIIFKGPKKGSIYVLSGNSPSDFQLALLRKNCGSAAWHNAIFPFQDDLGFMAADGSIQRLAATAAFGSFQLGHLSRDIATYLNDNVNRAHLRKCWAVNWESKGVVLFTMPLHASTEPNLILMLDYRFGDVPRFSPWPVYSGYCNSATLFSDENDNARQSVLIGGGDGYLRKLDVSAFSIDGTTGVNYLIKTPHLSYGTPHIMKTLTRGAIGFKPFTDSAVTLTWERDDNTTGSLEVEQGGGAILGEFLLGTDVLAGAQFTDRWFEMNDGGDFRSVAYQIQSSDINAKVSVHTMSAFISYGAQSMENA